MNPSAPAKPAKSIGLRLFEAKEGGTFAELRGFSLIELLVVLGVIGLLLALAIPAITSIKGGNEVTKAAYDVAEALEAAATYARSANTYVWVGFFEEDGLQESAKPAKPGVGKVVISMVASKDGTQVIDPTSAGTNPIPPDRLKQLGKLIKVDHIHLGDIPNPGTPNNKGQKQELDQRPSVVNGSDTYRIGETTPSSTNFPFQYPVGTATATAQYTFTKTIQFNPQGVAVLNGNFNIVPWLEVSLQPVRGNQVDQVDISTQNLAAVQISGINPQVRIFRK